MALESALQNLESALADLHEKLVELHLNLDQYTPSETADLLAKQVLPPPPVVSLAEKVTEMIAGVEQACAAARQAALSARHPRKIKEAQQALAIAQQRVADALEIFLNQITADHTAKILGRMAKEQMAKEEPGEDWLGWLQEVLKPAVNDCRAPLHKVVSAIFQCWDEFSTGLASHYFSVNTIGQQISFVEPREHVSEQPC